MYLKKIYSYCKERALNFSLKGILAAVFHSDAHKLSEADILFICHDNSRSAILDGKRYAPIIDTIGDDLDQNVSKITLPAPFSKYFGSTCHGNVVMYNRSFLIAYLQKFMLYRSSTIKNITSDPVVATWRDVLNKIKPKAIIGVNPSPELCIAAKSMHIWVADIQHGIIAPGNYYDLSKRAGVGQQGWPDVVLCWDRFSKDYVDRNCSPFVKSQVVGHPALFSQASQKLSSARSVGRSAGEIPILVTLTSLCPEGHKTDSYFQQIGIPKTLVDFIHQKGGRFQWHLRLHPAQLRNSKKEVFNALAYIFKDNTNVFWDECNNETLGAILSKCSVHITYNSASAREAAMLGVKTAVLDADVNVVDLYFGDLIIEKKVKQINPANYLEFSDWLVESHVQRIGRSNPDDESVTLKKSFAAFIVSLNERLLNTEIHSRKGL